MSKEKRPPVIAIMGHVDHGKSALLDYIRKTNVVESEAGGITQHVSAYEVEHEHEGEVKRITFLDTPGHEAFKKIRARGASVADIAILIVSAEEGVKPQTLDALSAIKESGIPYVVAINKIDKPGANVQQTQGSLVESEIYIEGMGGDVPWNAISAKTGEGVDELLDTLLLVADLEELEGETDVAAEGIVIEAHRDPKKGVTATLVIKNGTMHAGEFVTAGSATAPVRIFEDFTGAAIKEATFSSPVRVVGFSDLPDVGAPFQSYDNKKDAEAAQAESALSTSALELDEEDARHLVPIILKADVSGTLEAIEHEIEKLQSDRVLIGIVQAGLGAISEADLKAAVASKHEPLVIGFNVSVDSAARELADQNDIDIQTFDIIYKLTEWLESAVKERTPKIDVEECTGEAKILKYFSSMKNKHVVGGKVKDGQMRAKSQVHIERGKERIGTGKVLNLQAGKQSVDHVDSGSEFGAQIESDTAIQEGDRIVCFQMTQE